MARIKIEYPFIPTISNCKENIANGDIGLINYHLHKDNTWVGCSFKTLNERNANINVLEKEGGDYASIHYYQLELFRLENPNATRDEMLKYSTDYFTNLL